VDFVTKPLLVREIKLEILATAGALPAVYSTFFFDQPFKIHGAVPIWLLVPGECEAGQSTKGHAKD
jgi:hypothetical protein